LPSRSRELREAYLQLLTCGGFPEPFIKNSTRTLRRWGSERIERLVREDIRDLEPIRDLSLMEILVEILPSKVGSLLSLNSLREDVEVAHKTISHWMDILEQMYYHFRIYPFSAKTIQSLRKEPKMYLWDWSQLENSAARLENIVASHLYKFIHFHHDHDGHKLELHFLRDKEGREVDFLVTNNKKPWFCVEVKQSDTSLSPHISYFRERLKIPYCYQVVDVPNVDVIKHGVRILSVEQLLGALV
jgi:predicted AAA+ superfamily ATPase